MIPSSAIATLHWCRSRREVVPDAELVQGLLDSGEAVFLATVQEGHEARPVPALEELHERVGGAVVAQDLRLVVPVLVAP